MVFIHSSLTVIHSSNLPKHTNEVTEQPYHRPRGHGGKINRGKVVGKTIGETLHKTLGIEEIIMSRGGMIPEFFDRSTVSVVTAFKGVAQFVMKRVRR